jgi:2-oxoisovalerate dehydrogenase E1 component
LNMSAVWDLPVIYVCENNQYGMSTSLERANAARSIADRAIAYNIPGETVDGMDVLAVYQAVAQAAEHARSGAGPVLLDCLTYRYYGHSKSDRQVYRTKDEVQSWRQRDPIDRFGRWLVEQGYMTQAEVDASAARAQAAIDDAIAYGDASPEPSVEHLCDDVYAEEPEVLADPEHVLPGWVRSTFGPATRINPPPGDREITYSEALREAMSQSLESDPKVYFLGEDIGAYGGAFGVSVGMVERFGSERVRDTPISENTIVGCAIGSAVLGMRPIAEIQFMDFMTLAMEQTVLQGAKLRYMFGGRAQVPMVVRMPGGSGTGAAAQHSESLESWFINVPGLKTVAPSTAYDAKGLLLAAIADNNPVMFVENKLCYKMKGAVPQDPYIIPLGKADIKRRGKHLTVVAAGIMVHRALDAANKLSAEGIELEVVDLRTLKPYDAATVCESVVSTGRLLVVHEAPLIGGWGGEIVGAVAQSSAFAYLEAPIVRLGGADVPIPYNRNLERAAVPQTENIIDAARRLVKFQI